ncbi:MAG: hypothetical protein LE168_04175 [Endomicrobium sp.]|nr:hypothetical protein [Endomicrobium sp.]
MNMNKHIAVLLLLSIILSSCGKSDKGNDVTRTPPLSDIESVEKEPEPEATDRSLSEVPAVLPDNNTAMCFFIFISNRYTALTTSTQ